MKPSPLNYLFAYFPNVVLFGTAVLCGAIVTVACLPLAVSGLGLLRYLICIPAAAAAGFLIALVTLAIISPIFTYLVSQINGSPFVPGDRVYVFAGKYHDTTVIVKHVWKERFSIVVDGETAGDLIEIGQHQICRAEQAKPATPRPPSDFFP